MDPINTYTILPVDKRPIKWPMKRHETDAGLDLCFCPKDREEGSDFLSFRPIYTGETIMFETGIKLELPSHLMAFVLSRSGLATKGISVLNAPGLIDPGYRGEIKVILHNHSQTMHHVQDFDRIAQLVVLERDHNKPIYIFESNLRGSDGFGSTGA